MTRVRRALGATAVAWLLCQVTTLTLVPTALMLSLVDVDQGACTCGHGADATCPMHHHTPATKSKMCVMRSLTTSDASTLTSLLGLAGFLPARTLAILQSPRQNVVGIAPSTMPERQAPPDPPPPRS